MRISVRLALRAGIILLTRFQTGISTQEDKTSMLIVEVWMNRELSAGMRKLGRKPTVTVAVR
jgi:hypothetical protein